VFDYILFPIFTNTTGMTNLQGMSIFRKSVKNTKVPLNMTRILGTLHDDQYTFMTSPSFLHRMRNVTDKIVEETKTYLYYSIICVRKSCRL